MQPLLAGLDTEFGLLIEGRGASDQIEDATALVRSYPGECFVGWDYRYESPRSDLRGFTLKSLAIDPEDAKFDEGKVFSTSEDIRSDRILPNGARFYNDHGHPEYATPECRSLFELARQDAAGSLVVLRAAQVLAKSSGREVRIYKNNTDFHGASWGTHESYQVPRALGFERLFEALLPMMVVRQVLAGAGKVGAEVGQDVPYQLSQRADFFVEPANAETLFRRPIFNTRDEPHARPQDWIRLHVICGDSNMIPSATARKVGLMRLAIRLAIEGTAPVWRLKDPVRAAQAISRDASYKFPVDLEGKNWTNAHEIFESYFSAAEATLELSQEERWTIQTSRNLLACLQADFDMFARSVDWAAKAKVLQSLPEASRDDLRAYDLEYHNVDREEGLHAALEAMGEVDAGPEQSELEACLQGVRDDTRARARGVAVSQFRDSLWSACWRSITLRTENGPVELDLPPDASYPSELADTGSVENFVEAIRRLR
jgi:Pup amidohydrolase